MRRLPELNEDIKLEMFKMLLTDYSIINIAKALNLTRGYINKHCKMINQKPVFLGNKSESYFENENDYSNAPSYKMEELSNSELLAYINYEQKHKAYYD